MDRAEEQLTPDKMKLISKRLFLAGFFFLPFLWLVNAFFFRNQPRSFVVRLLQRQLTVIIATRTVLQTSVDTREREQLRPPVGCMLRCVDSRVRGVDRYVSTQT